jgi:progressive ankylosis protein
LSVDSPPPRGYAPGVSVPAEERARVDRGRILRLWWPLAASWMLMGVEMPLFTAVVARMPDPAVHLAAYGSVVVPVSLLIEAPIIMLLAASTALAKDWRDYRKLRRFTTAAGAALTAVHVAVAFTPVFDLVVERWIHVPEAVVEPARLGLRIMTPWSWSIALRRFQQGILVRFERSRLVSAGTAVRLSVNALVLLLGWLHGELPGVVVGTLGLISGVVAEAVFVNRCVQPLLRERLRPRPAVGEPLTRGAFLRFYVPLALTPALTLAVHPINAAAISRMPEALTSLAAWPAVYGMVFLLRSVGFAYNEVVVALVGEPDGVPALTRFAARIALGTTAALALFAATPLAGLWFGRVLGLAPELVRVARVAIAFAALMPAYTVAQNAMTGTLVHARRTRGIVEATALYLGVVVLALAIGVLWRAFPGIHYALCALTLGGLAQTLWLAGRCRPVLRALHP